MTLATANRNGLMGMGHARKLDKIKADILLSDPAAYGDIAPTLDLDFTNIYGAPFSGNFSRATIGGYRVNAKGVLVPTVANEPVIDFGSDGKGLGTRFDPAYTNLITYSEQLNNVAWGLSGATISPNSAVGPDGNATLDKIVESAGLAYHVVYQSPVLGAGTCTAMCVLKAGERTKATVQISDNVTSACGAGIDLITGAMTPFTAAHWTNVSAASFALANGCWLVIVTGTADQGTTKALQIYPADAGGVANYTGDGSSGIYAGFCMLTATAFPVPYVPTTSAAVARNADTFALTGTDFTDFFNPVEGVMFVSGFAPLATAGYPQALFASDNSYNNRVIIGYDGAFQNLFGYVESGGVVQANLQVSVLRGAEFKAAFSYKANEFRLSINGLSALSDLSGSIPAGLSKLNIGNDHASAGAWSNRLKRTIYWPKALSALDLKRITA